MENSISRILIETTVRRTLKNIRADPKRSIRNLVDMAMQFSQGRFQGEFFASAHTMLQNDSSAYYALVQDVANHVETEHLVRFGMNVGYNSCTWGARQIRRNEKELHFNIPWIVLFELDHPVFSDRLNLYDRAIAEGEHLGIYSWILSVRSPDDPLHCLELVQAHPDSAFFLLCPAEAVAPDLIKHISPLCNLMLVVRFDDAAAAACAQLRQAQLPYSVFFPYAQQEADWIIRGDLFAITQNLHPVFTVLVPRRDCCAQTRRLVYAAATEARNKQYYATIPWEICEDIRKLDEIISDDSCCVFFDREGKLLLPAEKQPSCGGNLFRDGLVSVIRRAYPKTAAVRP